MQRDKAKPVSYNTIKKNCKLCGFYPEDKQEAEEMDEEEIDINK
jgi:ribosomal protein L37E